MSTEIKVPTVGESINEVTVAQWMKKDGDFVEVDEILCELESDKATFEVTAESSGTLKIIAKEGETLEIGATLCSIDENGAGSSSDKSSQKSHAESSPKSEKVADAQPEATGEVKKMVVPSVGESITEVTLSQWMKKEGDAVELDEVLAEIESDKATFELTAEASGILHIVAEEGATLEVGAHVCDIEVTTGTSSKPSDSEHREATSKADDEGPVASPAASKIIAENNISAAEIKGTGKDGRITKEDALKAVEDAKSKPAVSKEEKTETAESPAPQVQGERSEERKRMSSLRKTVSRRLVAVKNETAMLTTFNEVDMKPIMDIRKQYKEQFKEKYEVGLGFMSFFTRAVTLALQEWPAVNAKIDGDEIIYHHYADISIAVSAPKGLMVPVIRNAERMSFQEIEKEIIRLATRARENKLSIEEMEGGTFTITNGGIFGSMLSTPIINAPQSAILGMHNIVERAVVINGEVVVRPMMYVALSYDHRIIDGRESVSFLVRVKQLLEDPVRLLLEI